MRTLLALVVVTVLLNATHAQFAPPEWIARTQCQGALGAFAGDVDGDGDEDLLIPGDGKYIWLFRNEGANDFSRAEEACAMPSLPAMHRFIDLDQDGDADFIGKWDGASSAPDTLAWHANDGTGHFGNRQYIAADQENINDMEFLDVDSDDDLDAVSLSMVSDRVEWYANNGSMVFGGPNLAAEPPTTTNTFTAGDLDGDGDPDLAYELSGSDGFTWLANDGTGTFSVAQVIDSIDVYGLTAADPDGDGDDDLVGNHSFYLDLRWYENDGSGQLQPAESIADNNQSLWGMLDVNDDGLSDLMFYSTGTARYSPGLGAGQFGEPEEIFLPGFDTNFITWGDLNGDGAQDFITNWTESALEGVFFKLNDGNGTFTGDRFPISQRAEDPTSLVSGDLDGDGDQDLGAVFLSGHKVSWFENPGNSDWREHIVDIWGDAWPHPEQANAGDADGDGDLDLLVTSHDGLYTGSCGWYLNDGSGTFTDGSGFVGHSTGYGSFNSVRADLNQDGLMDLLAFKDSVYYLENIPGSGFHYAVGLPVPGEWGFNTGDVGDVDGDGDPDIVVRGLSLLENAGDMTFSAPQTIVEEDSGPVVRLADMDGDGDPDIIAQAGNPRAVVWWENDGGYFIERHAITGTRGTDNEFVFLVEDFDTDGDMDIAAPLESGAPAYFLNHGDGTFIAPVLLREPGGMCSALCSGDFNGDGLRDLAMGLDGNSIWTANGYGASPYQLSGSIYIDGDGDGIHDPDEAPLPGAQVHLDPPTGSVAVQADGSFTAYVAAGTYTIAGSAPSEDWQPTAPTSHTATVDSGTPTATGLDLGFWDPTPQDSLIASITSSFLTCAGAVPFWATVVNTGTTTVSTSLRVGVDPLLDYVGADPTPDAILGDTLVWNTDTLHPFGSRTVAITVNMPGASFVGDPVHTGIRASGISLASGSPLETEASRTDTIACGSTSNVKSCDPPGEGIHHTIPFATPYLDYTILFQNTGSSTAHTVIVRDQLPAALLVEGLVVTGSSHPYTIMVDQYWESLTEYRFTFIGIDLPPQSIDPLGSQGFISLRLPVDHANAGHGTYVTNYASIDFLSEEMTGFTSYADVVLTDCDLLQPGIYESAGSGQTSLNSTEGYDYYEHYTWYLNGEALPGTNWWNLWPDQSGLYTVEVTDQFGCVVMSEPYAWVMQGLGIPDPRGWRMFPNPATGDVRVVSSESVQGITLIDVTGRKVFEDRFSPRNEMVLERGALPSGLYHIVLYGAGSHRLGTDRIVFE